MVHLGSRPHRLHLVCYGVFRVKTEASLRCPACHAVVTVDEVDRRALQQHIGEITV